VRDFFTAETQRLRRGTQSRDGTTEGRSETDILAPSLGLSFSLFLLGESLRDLCVSAVKK
jgi:hypothetical protein